MNHSTPGLPVHHQLPESTQTHVCCVSDAIQPSHPLSSPSPPALNLSQHQGLFTLLAIFKYGIQEWQDIFKEVKWEMPTTKNSLDTKVINKN